MADKTKLTRAQELARAAKLRTKIDAVIGGHGGPLPTTYIANAVGVDKSAVYTQLKHLVKSGELVATKDGSSTLYERKVNNNVFPDRASSAMERLTTKPKLGKENKLVQAAQLRANIDAYVRSRDEEVTIEEIASVLGIERDLAYKQVNLLVGQGILTKMVRGDFAYYSKGGKKSASSKSPTKTVKVNVVAPVTMPDIKVEYVSSTGGLRFKLNGVSVEFSVVES